MEFRAQKRSAINGEGRWGKGGGHCKGEHGLRVEEARDDVRIRQTLNLLNVEADGGNCGDNFSKLKFVQNGSFTGSIEANHENTNIFLAEEAGQHLRKRESHCCGAM